MPVDRTVGAQYAQRIIDLYAVVEMQLAEIVAKGVKSNAQRDDLSQKLLALSEVRRSAEAAMRKLDGKVGPAVQRALHAAAVAGGRAAQEDLLKIRDKRAVGRRRTQLDRNLVNSPSLLRLAASLSPALESRLRSTHLQVVRSVGDIYQTAVAAMAAPGVLAGVTTRREASQKALDHLWQRGVTGFTDKAGRNWNLATYVEMATRTATAQASVQAHLDQLAQNGLDLVMVSSDGGPCPLCQPWEGKVLTTGSTTGRQHVTRPSELDDTPTAVHIDGSVGEATAAGLFHPSCRHRLVAYLPGLTTAPPTASEGADVYAAEQVQRRLEREARRIAIAQAGAVDPAAARELVARYRAKRAEIAQHVKDNPKLRRKTERERVDLGHAPSATSTTLPPIVVPPVAPKVAKPKPVEAPKPVVVQPKPKPVEAPKPAETAPVRPARSVFTPKELNRQELDRIYAGRFNVDGAKKDPARLQSQLKEIGVIDERLHERMSKYMGTYRNGGIYIGPGGCLSSAPWALKDDFEGSPRGYPPGSTWEDVGGCYCQADGVLIIAEDKHPIGGRHSTAQHEFGHAVDSMTRGTSSSDEYKKFYDQIARHISLNPYYSETGNPRGYLSESFAELFNGYVQARGKSESAMVKIMLSQLGMPLGGTSNIAYAIIKGPAEEARLDLRDRQLLAGIRGLIKIFDEIHEGKR